MRDVALGADRHFDITFRFPYFLAKRLANPTSPFFHFNYLFVHSFAHSFF